MHPTRPDADDESTKTDDPDQYLPAMPPKTVVRALRRLANAVSK